jgi:hypothetical protein
MSWTFGEGSLARFKVYSERDTALEASALLGAGERSRTGS